MELKNINQGEWRREFIAYQLFQGMPIDEKLLFTNPGYRGLEILPYPKHVKKMISELNAKANIKLSDHKRHVIYQGKEMPEFRELQRKSFIRQSFKINIVK